VWARLLDLPILSPRSLTHLLLRLAEKPDLF
jgi:hypothetical protein